MKIILEKYLDFKQFQNLIILTFITVMVFLGMLNSLDFKSYYNIEIVLFFLILIFISVLFTKKGLLSENQELYTATFLFGFVLRKTVINISDFQQLSIINGKLSTNYGYTYDIKRLRYWEPNLNYSETSFAICMVDETKAYKKILRLTKSEKVKLAIDFIVRNTNLQY
ncbi:hypothetical protein D3C87_1233510 [compost metagenome]